MARDSSAKYEVSILVLYKHYGEKDTEKAIYFHISADQSVLCDKKTRVRTYMSVWLKEINRYTANLCFRTL